MHRSNRPLEEEIREPNSTGGALVEKGADVFQEFQDRYTQTKADWDRNQQGITDYVRENTEEEMTKVQEALKVLYEKEQAVLESPEMKTKQQEATEAYYILEDLIAELKDLSRRAFRRIQRMNTSEARKQTLWNEVTAGIERVVYSEDERRAVSALRNQLEGLFAGRDLSGRSPGVSLPFLTLQ